MESLSCGMVHNKLRRVVCNEQIKVEHDDYGIEHLVYVQDPLQKTNKGGLACKNCNKKVFVYPGTDQTRCPVYYYKKYTGLLPTTSSCAKLYLRPKKNFSLKVWYCDQPYGFNKIKSTVREICGEA